METHHFLKGETMDFLEIVKQRQDELVNDLFDLIKIDSLLDEDNKTEGAPFGPKVREALDYVLNKGQADGFKTKDLEGYAGIISLGEQDDCISVLGHLDVVPASGEWFSGPFEPIIKDGYIVGRGSGDDKGPTVAAYHALKILKDLGYTFKHRIDLILGCDEETGMRCMDYYKTKEKLPLKGIVPDADFPVIFAEKGILQFDLVFKNTTQIVSMKAGSRPNIVIDHAVVTLNEPINEELFGFYKTSQNLDGKGAGNSFELFGKAFHASLPHYGNNAAMHALSFVSAQTNDSLLAQITKGLRNTFGSGVSIAQDAQSMGALTMSLGVVDIDEENIRLTLDIRYPRETNAEFILDQIQSTFKEAVLENVHDSEPLYNDPQSDLVKACISAYQKVSGDYDTPAKTMGGGTYARTLPNHVAFGSDFPKEVKPEWVGGPHEINEAISVDALVKACAIYCETLVELAQGQKV